MPRDRVQFGYKLSSEEFAARELVRLAAAAEEHGFEFALISDHFHPWTDRQGQSPFVWSVLGGIAASTRKLRVGTAVTCPTMRLHPAIIAQAAATMASMMPERFFLGLGAGENLNEHILGERWPETEIRHARLAEAIQVIRLLWKGGLRSHHGTYYTLENARIYSLPEQPPPVYVAAAGPKGTQLAIAQGDGLIGTEADQERLVQFRNAAGDKPCYAEATVCYGANEEVATKLAKERWPIAALPGALLRELALPVYFEEAGQLATEEKISQIIPCGPDPDKHLQAIQQYVDAGYDYICIHQIGPEQAAFMDFFGREIFPQLGYALSPAPQKGMRYADLVARVKQIAGLEQQAADRLSRAAIKTLAESAGEKEVWDWSAQFPKELQISPEAKGVISGGSLQRYSPEEFYRHISSRAGMTYSEAVSGAKAVAAVLLETLPGDLLERMKQNLPSELSRQLFPPAERERKTA